MKRFDNVNYSGAALIRQFGNKNACVINEGNSDVDTPRTTTHINYTCRDSSNTYYGNIGSVRCDGFGVY